MRRKPRRIRTRDVPYRPPREQPHASAGFSLLFRFYRRYMAPLRGLILPYILLSTAGACSTYLIAWYGKIAVDDILRIRVAAGVDQPPVSPVPDAPLRLFLLLLLYVGTVVALNRLGYLAFKLRHRMGLKFTVRLRDDLHRSLQRLSTLFHRTVSPGRLMARLLHDVDIAREYIVGALTHDLVPQSAMLVAGFFILLSVSPACATVVTASMVPYCLALAKSRRRLRFLHREIRHSNACLWGLAAQKFDSMRAILAYGREAAEARDFFRLSAVMQRDTIARQHVDATLGRAADLIAGLTTGGLLLFCASRVLRGTMTLGEMMYVNGAVTALYAPLRVLTDLAVKSVDLLVILGRLDGTMNDPRFLPEAPDARPVPSPLRDGMALRGVSFRYRPDAPDVLHDLSVSFPAGRTVAVMGPSGAGKSTLLGLLARLWDPTAGEVLLDALPLEKAERTSLRRTVAFVPQEAQIFSGTIRENIAYARPDAPDNCVRAAAAQADIEAFVRTLPNGFDTRIGEKGMTLSGGQRQRISLARAFLTDPPILLLDDVTSALDADTERHIQETLARLMAGRTAILATHRVSMALRCDFVLVLEHGRITAFDSPAALRACPDSFFARLCRAQLTA